MKTTLNPSPAAALAVALSLLAAAATARATTVELTVSIGGGDTRKVVIELNERDVPKTCANFKKLCEEGFYNGLAFHRVIPNYIVQAGDPMTKDVSKKALWGTGGPGYTVPAELGMAHVRGAVAMARLGDAVNPTKASSGSQFYVCLREIPALDGEYTVFAKVVSGLEALDAVANVVTDSNNNPVDRVEIQSAVVREGPQSGPGNSITPVPNLADPDALTDATAPPSNPAMTGRGLPPMPKLATDDIPQAPAPAAPGSALDNDDYRRTDRGLPPMPDLNATAATPPPATNDGGGFERPMFGPSGGGRTEAPTARPIAGEPGAPVPPQSVPSADGREAMEVPANTQPPPEKPRGVIGRFLHRFW
ncbi:MAG: peptidylprolyl isomerase [Akkermansiaceae bacterium]|nr:peptidylprolyl isomerase [Akkermansiaceae bacterium]